MPGSLPRVIVGECLDPRAGTGYARLSVFGGRPRGDRPRPLPPPAPAGATEDGSPLAQESGRRPHRDRPPDRPGPPHRATLPRRVPQRWLGSVPATPMGGPAERTARPRRHSGRLLPGAPAALHGRSPSRHRTAHRGEAWAHPGAALLKKTLGLRWRKVGTIPAKADPEEQADFLKNKLQPRLRQAERGQRTVLFVDAAHFVYGP